MAEPAVRPMTVEEFLDWHPGDDRRYELVDGVPMSMAPPTSDHGRLAMTLGGLLWPALRSSGCSVFGEAGVRLPRRGDRFYVVDAAISCVPPDDRWIEEPRVLFEILSPSTESHDRRTKLTDYRLIPSVEEIVLIHSRVRYCEVHRRGEDGRWLTDLYRDADDIVELMDGRVELPLRDLYEGVALESGDAAE